MNTPRFAFFGTADFAVKVLEELGRHSLVPTVVITAPDRPAGRGLVLTSSPVKQWALAHALPVLTPEKITEEFCTELEEYSCEVGVLAAYGKLIPPRALHLFPHQILNVHPSLLPKFRGPTPVQAQILAAEREVGVSVIVLDEQMDHGPVVGQWSMQVNDWMNGEWSAPRLNDELWQHGAALLAEKLPERLADTLTPATQDETVATFTSKISKEDGEIDLNGDPQQNFLKYLAYQPWPGVYFFAERSGTRVRVTVKKARFENGKFLPERVVPEGKKEMNWAQF